MRVTECLGIEHRILLRQIGRLEEAQQQAAPAGEQRAMVSLLATVLEEHADVEDQVLFPALEPLLGRQGGPLAVMDMEHQELRRLLSQLAAATEDVTPLVSQFIATARDHFAKEDRVLFPLAEQLLSQERLEELGQACLHVQPLERAR